MKNKDLLAYLFLAVAVVVLGLVVYRTLLAPKTPPPTPAVQPTEPPIPTLTQEEFKIISEIETKTVTINPTVLEPKTLTVKLHDQVQFVNNSRRQIRVVGETGWGDVPLAQGENMSQSFKTAGTFKYTVPSLNLQGEIVVK